MQELKNKLKNETQGLIGISDTNRTDTTGRWLLLVKANTFHKTRKHIAANLQAWIHHYPPEIHEMTPDTFPSPQVSMKFTDKDDDDSSGHASYMSSSVMSYGSFDETDSADQ